MAYMLIQVTTTTFMTLINGLKLKHTISNVMDVIQLYKEVLWQFQGTDMENFMSFLQKFSYT